MNRLNPLIRDFGNSSNVNKLAEMAASLETAAPAFKGSADEQAAAAEGLQQLMLTMRKIPTMQNFDQLGVKIWEIDPKTKQHVLRDWFDIIGDIKKKVPDKLMLEAAVGGKGQAYMALDEMLTYYDKLVQLKNEALGSDQVAKDNAAYMSSASARIDIAWNHIKNSLAEALTPERIDAFADALGRAAKLIGDTADLVDHIFGGQKKEEQQGFATQDFVNAANNGTVAGDRDATKAAQDLLSVDASGPNWKANYERFLAAHQADWSNQTWQSLAGGASGAGASQQALLAHQAAADAFLDTMGRSFLPALARTIGDAIAKGMARVQLHTKIGAEPVQKAAASSMEHRRGRTH